MLEDFWMELTGAVASNVLLTTFKSLEKKTEKQAGAELCQAQDSLSSLPTGFGLA